MNRAFASFFFFFNDTATTEIYTLPLHDALPICGDVSWRDLGGWRGARLPRRERASRRRTLDGQGQHGDDNRDGFRFVRWPRVRDTHPRRRRSEEHTSELQSPCNLVCRLLLEKKK